MVNLIWIAIALILFVGMVVGVDFIAWLVMRKIEAEVAEEWENRHEKV